LPRHELRCGRKTQRAAWPWAAWIELKIASLGIQEDVPLLLYSKSGFSYYYLLLSIFCYVKEML
jgi:hypothetical protein